VATVDESAVLAALQAGESQNSVARRLGYGVATVNRIAKRNGVKCIPHPKTVRSPEEIAAIAAAHVALVTYDLERRIALLDKVFNKAEQMLDTVTTPHKLQALCVSLGILIDKRRLEDGEVTSRTEINGDAIRERLASRLDELAARRRSTGAA
jgi:hypothetical protein